MLILDPQVDFHRGGSCAIKDADISSESVSNFISFNKDGIEEIYVGLDSHHRCFFHSLQLLEFIFFSTLLILTARSIYYTIVTGCIFHMQCSGQMRLGKARYHTLRYDLGSN